MKHIRTIFAAMMMLFAASAFAQSEGAAEYSMLNPPRPTNSGEKIEVLEFFFYGCSHCFHLHPQLSAWQKHMPKDVQLDFVPTQFNPSWEPMAYTYYALKAMGLADKLDDKLYNAWNLDRLVLVEQDAIADFVAQQGVDRKQFLDYYRSFSVHSQVEQSKQMMHQYQIEGTPTLIVDGKYSITGLGPEETIRVLNQLIAKARRERTRH